MRKLLFLLLLCPKIFAITTGASLNIAPTTVFTEQKMGASLAIWNYNYSSGGSLIVLDIVPQTWVTVGGSSAVSVAWDKPALGPGQQTTISPGSSLIFRYTARFHAPSIFPAHTTYYANGASVSARGTQTYSVGTLVRTDNGETNSSDTKTITVLPISLPNAERSYPGGF